MSRLKRNTIIKPFDERGENIDITSECVYDDTNRVNYYNSSGYIVCMRKVHNFSYSGTNVILCEVINKTLEISSNNKKYYVFIDGTCTE